MSIDDDFFDIDAELTDTDTYFAWSRFSQYTSKLEHENMELKKTIVELEQSVKTLQNLMLDIGKQINKCKNS